VVVRDLADIADVITKSKRIVQSFDVGCKFDLGAAKVDFGRFILVVIRWTVTKDDGFGFIWIERQSICAEPRVYTFAHVQEHNFVGLYSWLWQLIAHARSAYQF